MVCELNCHQTSVQSDISHTAFVTAGPIMVMSPRTVRFLAVFVHKTILIVHDICSSHYAGSQANCNAWLIAVGTGTTWVYLKLLPPRFKNPPAAAKGLHDSCGSTNNVLYHMTWLLACKPGYIPITIWWFANQSPFCWLDALQRYQSQVSEKVSRAAHMTATAVVGAM